MAKPFPFPMISFVISTGIALSIMAYAWCYVRGIMRGDVRPMLATWVLFLLAAILSFITNFAETGAAGLAANFYNVVDSLAIATIVAVLLFHKNTRRTFITFEKACIGAAIAIAIAWYLSGENIIAHLAIQAILVIAYIPTVVHLCQSSSNTESLPMWILNGIGAALGVIVPLQTMSILPLVYGLRSVISIGLMVVLILRLQQKSPNASPKEGQRKRN